MPRLVEKMVERNDLEQKTGWLEICKKFFAEIWLMNWELMKILVPLIIATKIFEELGLISVLSAVLEPVMSLIGLPGSLGLVWATAMLTGLYGGMAVFASLAPMLDLTAAQVTVLCSAMLLAHGLPVELSVSKKAGANLLPIAILRVGGAIIYCFILNKLCLAFDIWQNEAVIFFKAASEDQTLLQWSVEQVQNLGLIVCIIFLIVIAMRALKAIGIIGLMEKILAPVLPVFGMGKQAAPVTVVGMIMGLIYGSTLIIGETSKGNMSKGEVFSSMAMLGLCHGLIEDTLLMVAIGGKLGGILWGRILFSLVVVYFVVRFLKFLSTKRGEKAYHHINE